MGAAGGGPGGPAAISRMAEFWDPEIELDTSGGPILEIARAMPETAWSC